MVGDLTLDRVFGLLAADVEPTGCYEGPIRGIASLTAAEHGDLSFLGNAKYRSEVPKSEASVLILPKGYEGEPREGQIYLRVSNPSLALAQVCREIEKAQFPKPEPGVHPSAVIDPTAHISENASIGPLCVVGPGARVGAVTMESHVCVGREAILADDSLLQSGAKVGAYCEIGANNRLLPGCVIGSDGYGYEYSEGAHQRVPQVGTVKTGKNVDIGANTTVDRARFGETLIGDGTKIDNQVQVAHNVRIGRHCLIVAQVGISGSTVLGDGVVLAGQAGVAGHLELGPGVQVAGASAVNRSIPAGKKVRGNPAIDMMLHDRLAVLQRKLPHLFKRFDQLEKSLESSTPLNR